MLRAKNHRQPNASTTSPPTTGAAAAAVLPMALHIPMAHARRPPAYAVLTADSEAVMNSEVASPCTTRAATSTSKVGASAAPTVPAQKRSTPIRSMRRRPNRSAVRPDTSKGPAAPSAKALMTQPASAELTPRSWPICGSATATPLKSMLSATSGSATATRIDVVRRSVTTSEPTPGLPDSNDGHRAGLGPGRAGATMRGVRARRRIPAPQRASRRDRRRRRVVVVAAAAQPCRAAARSSRRCRVERARVRRPRPGGARGVPRSGRPDAGRGRPRPRLVGPRGGGHRGGLPADGTAGARRRDRLVRRCTGRPGARAR